MKLELKKLKENELMLLHDFYFDSAEPDAPKKPFLFLDSMEKLAALIQYSPDFHLAAYEGENLIGFVGIYPDDDFIDLDIFYVINPAYRGKGYFSILLQSLVVQCRQYYSEYKYIRALTRKSNLTSIKGLKRASFFRNGECIEELESPVPYEEYLLPMD